MTWVKICGTTNLEDALTAVDAGADAVGFVFYEKSPRNISIAAARQIVDRLPKFVEKVGVFVNEHEDFICSVAKEAALTAVQMHGHNEDPHVADLVNCCSPQLKILAAVSMYHPNPVSWARMWDTRAIHAFLLDSGTSSKPGGTGAAFEWSSSASVSNEMKTFGRVAVAGGLTPTNVHEAIAILKPWGVDVASGVETRSGRKDPEKVRAFVNAVREIDRKTS